MLEPEEFEFYELLQAYKDRFGDFPPTHHLPEKQVMLLLKEAIRENQPITTEFLGSKGLGVSEF
ncbi:MAG: hypothetical protein HUU10_00205 [Bacteroidetes bacterium]|nr:hypothetical protein [Bacteroidota bacterium]